MPPPRQRPRRDWRGALRHVLVVAGILAGMAIIVAAVALFARPSLRRRVFGEPKPIEEPRVGIATVERLRKEEEVGPYQFRYEYDVLMEDGKRAVVTLTRPHPPGARLRMSYARTSGDYLLVYSHVGVPSAAAP